MEKEIEDIEFRLIRGSHLGRYDQFWDEETLFKCRNSRSKWLNLNKYDTSRGAPLETYLHVLKRNKNIIHITFSNDYSNFDISRFLADLPWVTSISWGSFGCLPTFHRVPLFIKSTDNDLITFAKKIRLELDPFSTYIFTDAGDDDMFSLADKLGNNAGVLISFVAPASSKSLILRLKHSGIEDGPLKVTLGSTEIQLNPSSKSSLTIDDIALYPIQVPSPSESDYLSFEPEIRNDIFIQFRGTVKRHGHGHLLHDIELLDENGLEYRRSKPCIEELDHVSS